MQFRDRREAGARLAAALREYAQRHAIVLALPRGGVPVGFEVARALDAELDVFVVRKLGAPGREELAMGAIASGGVRVLNRDVIEALRVDEDELERAIEREQIELRRRELLYRDARELPVIAGRVVILVDDGLATGSTMRAAVAAVRALKPARVVVAVPAGSAESCRVLRSEVDQLVCLSQPDPFHAVGLWYADFRQTSDAEVHDLLTQARGDVGEGATGRQGDRERGRQGTC